MHDDTSVGGPGRRGVELAPCARWSSSGVGRPLRPAERPVPEPGARAAAAARRGLRRLPHRPAPARRRGDRSPSRRACSATRSSAIGRRERPPRVGVPWLGWTCGECALLPRRPREPLRRGPLHRPRHRRRLRRVRRRRRALLLPDPGRLPGRAGGAAAVRGADRLPRAARCAATRTRLGLYGFGAAAHILAQVARAQGRRVFAFTRAGRRGGAGVRARARRRVGGRLGRGAAGAARRGDHLRPGRRARARRAAGARARAARSSAAAST